MKRGSRATTTARILGSWAVAIAFVACAGGASPATSDAGATASTQPSTSGAGPDPSMKAAASASSPPGSVAASEQGASPTVPLDATGTPQATASPRPTNTAKPTAKPTPAITPRPTRSPPRPTPSPRVPAGNIAFDSGATYGPGEFASWQARLTEPAGNAGLLWVLIERLADGRQFEHWREPLAGIDPSTTSLTDRRDLWIYAHNGAGKYLMQYMREDGTVLAEGALELLP